MRVTTCALHSTTRAVPTGLGARLAGSSASEEVWNPRSSPYPSSHALLPPSTPLLSPRRAAQLEVARWAEMCGLREELRGLCEAQRVRTPMNAFERWRFHSKWEEEADGLPTEPLLPAKPPAADGEASPSEGGEGEGEGGVGRWAGSADARMLADLRRAGLSPAASRSLLLRLRASSAARAEQLARLRASLRRDGAAGAIGRLRVRIKQGEDGSSLLSLSLSEGGPLTPLPSLRLTSAHLRKLSELYTRHAGSSHPSCSPREERRFRFRLAALLLRYEAIGGLGFQAALGGAALVAMQRELGTNFECFASPLNCFYGAYCSAFPDVDVPFGSLGSFNAFQPIRGSYVCSLSPPLPLSIRALLCIH